MEIEDLSWEEIGQCHIDLCLADGIKIRFITSNTFSKLLIINWLSPIRLAGLWGSSCVFKIIAFSVGIGL